MKLSMLSFALKTKSYFDVEGPTLLMLIFLFDSQIAATRVAGTYTNVSVTMSRFVSLFPRLDKKINSKRIGK